MSRTRIDIRDSPSDTVNEDRNCVRSFAGGAFIMHFGEWSLVFDFVPVAFTAPLTAYVAKLENAVVSAPRSGPRIGPGCVVNAASFVGGGVAPGEIVSSSPCATPRRSF